MAQVFGSSTNDCTIDVTGESTTDLPTSHSATTPGILGGFFTTDASATDVVLQLRNTTATTAYDCHWGNVAVYAVRSSYDHIKRNWIYQYIDEEHNGFTTFGPTRELVWGGNSCVWNITLNYGCGAHNDKANLMVDVNGAGMSTLRAGVASCNNVNDTSQSVSWVLDEAQLDGVTATTVGDGIAIQLEDRDASGSLFRCSLAGTRSSCRIIVEQLCGQ